MLKCMNCIGHERIGDLEYFSLLKITHISNMSDMRNLTLITDETVFSLIILQNNVSYPVVSNGRSIVLCTHLGLFI